MRTFLLIDKDGNTYNITSKDTAFFYGITGLGYEEDTTFQRIKERFTLLKKELAQGEIVGTIRFWQNKAESKYYQFAQFCQNSPHRLVYSPEAGTAEYADTTTKAFVFGTTLYLPQKRMQAENFYRNGYITKIEKSDGVGDCLTVQLTFKAETPWYKEVSDYNYGGTGSRGKKYDYQYSFNYGGGVVNTVAVNSDSRQPCPARIIIMGAVDNPEWHHYLNGELVSSGKVNGSVLEGNRLVIDTTTIPYSIKQFDELGNLVSDMYQQSDFSTERFVRLGYGNNTISVSATGADIIGIGVEAQIEYATV